MQLLKKNGDYINILTSFTYIDFFKLNFQNMTIFLLISPVLIVSKRNKKHQKPVHFVC